MENFQKEVVLTSALGGLVGAVVAILLYYIRGFEVQKKGPMIKQVLKPDSLNFDDTEDRLSSGRLSEGVERERQCRFSNYDEEEERIGLIDISETKRDTETGILLNTYDNLNLQSDSDGEDGEQLVEITA